MHLFIRDRALRKRHGSDFYENSEIARYIFDQAGEELDLDMKELCFEENDRLDLTEYTQAAMVTTCLAMTRVAESKGLKADITAGLSLGEYPAIAAAGGMNDMDAIRLVRKRGILMQNTVPAGEGACVRSFPWRQRKSKK